MATLRQAASTLSLSIEQIEHAVRHHQPRKKRLRALMLRSAVALILREQPAGSEILMIKRAERKGDPWSGHMAFPGGRMEPQDRHGLDVAKRETFEEIGLALGPAEPCIGRLSEITARPRMLHRRAMVVSPFLFRLDREVEFSPNYEVAEVVWVPVDFLADRSNRETMQWKRDKVPIPLPCYMFEGRRIWGLSLMMLDELLALLPAKN